VSYNVGNYDYYLEKRVVPVPAPASTPAPTAVTAAPKKRKDKPRKLTWKEEREWESMETNILAAEQEVFDLEATFARAGFLYETAR
jgi:ATP-binding cassette subfamily F protein uup